MVHVKFFGLIRSNHKIVSLDVHSGTLKEIINQIQKEYPKITDYEFNTAIVFINKEKVMHLNRLNTLLKDGDEVVFTNFVGGG